MSSTARRVSITALAIVATFVPSASPAGANHTAVPRPSPSWARCSRRRGVALSMDGTQPTLNDLVPEALFVLRSAHVQSDRRMVAARPKTERAVRCAWMGRPLMRCSIVSRFTRLSAASARQNS